MKKRRRAIRREAMEPKWERAENFGYVFIAICIALGIFHIAVWFAGYHDPVAMVVSFGCALMIYGGVWLGKRKDNIQITAMIYFVLLLLFGYYGFFLGGGDGTGAYWCFLQPMIALYVLGLYYGVIFIVIQLAFIMLCFFTPVREYGWPYTRAELIFIPLSYVALSAITFYSQWELWKNEKEQERLLEETRRANASKSDFLANMSHEIRTPMNAIMGMCEMALNEEISEEAREDISGVLVAGNNLLGIINDILDFSKIDSGKFELIETVYETASLLNDVISLVENRKKNTLLEFIVDCDPQLPRKLVGDEMRIRQILVNLLSNAVKYTREGGVLLSVSARQESYGVNLKFTVKDSGIGIKKENMQKIFHTFSQVDTRKNREVEGTGLGLPIAKRLAESMGGFIWVKSEYGKGSEFTLVIPQKVEDAAPMAVLNDREHMRGLYFWNGDKYTHPFCRESYRTALEHLVQNLGFPYDVCSSRDELAKRLALEKRYTHLFMSREEYLQAEELVKKASEKMRVVVAQSRHDHIQLPDNMICVHKPLYIVPLVNAMNSRKNCHGPGMATVKQKGFCAPDAKILIVDDNMINIKVAMGLMEPYQMQMDYADNGGDAIAMLKRSPDYDMVFLDHMMPGMDGMETAERIRSIEGDYFRNVPIVALTANAVSGVKEKFLANGFQDYLPKPVELNHLEQILKRWLPQEKLRDLEEETR